MRVICTADAFRVGGRETYLGTYLQAFRAAGVRTTLLARTIRKDNPELGAIDDVIEIPTPIDENGTVAAWLEAGRRVAGEGPTVLWAQHFDVHLCWVLSRALGIPMLVTFHGPLFGGGRPNSPAQALGIALGIRMADGVSAVSNEVVTEVARFSETRNVALLPNVVDPGGERLAPRTRERTFVVATRTEKLGHLRRAVEVFAASRRLGLVDRLEIVLPTRAESGSAEALRELRHGIGETWRTLGRRWLLGSSPSVMWATLATRFPDAQFSVAERIAGATAVLGMGRALLEGAAAGRPCILIGYDEVHGLLTKDRFEDFARTNFSGRSNAVISPAAAAKELATHPGAGEEGSAWAVKARDVSEWAPRVLKELEKVADQEVHRDETLFVENVLLGGRKSTSNRSESSLVSAVMQKYGDRLRDVYEVAIVG